MGPRIHATAFVCDKAELLGEVILDAGTFIHPTAVLDASAPGSAIVIGKQCLVNEYARIRAPPGTRLVIGDNNVFETSCGPFISIREVLNRRVMLEVSCSSIGDWNTVGCRALVMGNLSDECVINAACTVNAGETLEPHTVVFGSNNAQCKQPQSTLINKEMHQNHIEYLTKSLVKYHNPFTVETVAK